MRAITTLADLNALDESTMVQGYLAAISNTPDYTRREQAYWHGYLNGEVDAGRVPISPEQQELARVFVAAQRAH